MRHIYDNNFSEIQINETKQWMRKQIFFLLLIVDPTTKDEYKFINVEDAFTGLLRDIGGLNELLFCPVEIVKVMSLLQAALIEYKNPDFQFKVYRKLVLDAGSEVNKIKEVN